MKPLFSIHQFCASVEMRSKTEKQTLCQQRPPYGLSYGKMNMAQKISVLQIEKRRGIYF
jgi:hypothetical protein